VFTEISPYEIKDNVFTAIGKDWMLLTAGNREHFNTMTVSWGFLGVIWRDPTVEVFVRPQRYTREFMDGGDVFTLSVLPEEYRDALNFCGSKSGREFDKCKETGLTPAFGKEGGVYFEQARLALVCRKIYVNEIRPACFLDESIASHYALKDYHKRYFGKIEHVYVK